MARRGRFGRLPRRNPDLSATMVALAREMQNLRDQNIKTAWEKGGEFEGKEVTDEMIVQHWKDRRAGVDTNDPLWDYYNNLVENYEFSIEESKMTLKYAQHKVGEGAMASFYRKWANKLPQDSEAYRTLMRSAAQYADISSSRGRGSSAASKQKAYNAEYLANYNKHVKPYRDATEIMVEAAVQAGILTRAEADRVHLRNSGSRDGAELTEMLIASGPDWDQNQLLLLFDHINTDPEYAIYKDALKKGGIESLTYDSYIGLAEGRKTGMKNGIRISNKYGDSDTAEKTREASKDWAREIRLLQDVDEVAAYNSLRAEYEQDVVDASDNPFLLDRLSKEYAADLRALGMKATDPATRGAMFAEADANEGKLSGRGPDDWGTASRFTVKENPTGRRQTDVTEGNDSDLGETIKQREYLDSVLEGLSKGEIVRVDARTAKDVFKVDPEGAPFAYVPIASVDALERDNKGAVIFTTSNGRTVPQFVPYTEVHARSAMTTDPTTKRMVTEAKPTPGMDTLLGYQFVGPDGTVHYGTFDLNGTGQLHWSTTNPYAEGYAQVAGEKGTIAVMPASATGKPVYNPKEAVNPRFGTDDPANPLMNSDRWPDVFGAAHLGNSSGRLNLINVNEDDVRAYYTSKYGNQTQPVPDPADPNKQISVKVVDLAMQDLHDQRVKAAAYERDPKLLQREAAASAGVKFWEDYELRAVKGRLTEADRLIAESPAAREVVEQGRIAAQQRRLFGQMPSYQRAIKDEFGVVEVLSPQEVRQKAIDTLNESAKFKAAQAVFSGPFGIGAPSAENIVDKTPPLKLPDVMKTLTGQAPTWFQKPQPYGPPAPPNYAKMTPAWSPGVAGVGTGAAAPKPPAPKPKPVEPPPVEPPPIKPPPVPMTSYGSTGLKVRKRIGGPTVL